MKRVLVTGAGGFVGARIMAQLGGRLELIAAPAGALRSAGPEEVERLVEAAAPDAILHTAAISDTGYCEQHPEESRQANVELPVQLARAARRAGAKLVAFSSDQVYTGLEGPGPFDETVPLRPANVYGRHKREAEERVLEELDSAVLLRATWMYDLPGGGLPIRPNLPLNLLAAAKEGRRLAFSAADARGVTWVRQAVEHLLPTLDWPGGRLQLRLRERRGYVRHRPGFLPAAGAGRAAGGESLLASLPCHGRRQSPPAGCGLRRHGGGLCPVPRGPKRIKKGAPKG